MLEQVVFRIVFADEVLDHLVGLKLDVLDRVRRCSKAVLTNHDRQADVRILGDRHRLNVVVIGFLIVLGEDLNPAGIACAHGIRMVVVDVDRTGQCAADQREGDRKAGGRSDVQQLPHQRETARGGCGDCACTCGGGTDTGGHGGVLGLDGDILGVDLTVCDVLVRSTAESRWTG